jgi:hypothetical protein
MSPQNYHRPDRPRSFHRDIGEKCEQLQLCGLHRDSESVDQGEPEEIRKADMVNVLRGAQRGSSG